MFFVSALVQAMIDPFYKKYQCLLKMFCLVFAK
jgi:hypothetical protein